MTEELVRKYVPHLRYDRCEPYALAAVGYTVYRESGKSVSCNLQVRVEPGETAFEEAHVVEYVQPGKHAFMPAPRYFWLAPDRDAVCSRLAGSDGLLVAPMFEGRITKDDAFDEKVARYIREQHSFTPSWKFVKALPQSVDTEELLMPWEKLDVLIVDRIGDWKRRIEEAVEG